MNIDIDDRKRAETALQDSEKKFAALFAASPAPLLILQPDEPRFTISEVNEAYLAATMRSREDVLGRGVFEAYPDNAEGTAPGGARLLCASFEQVLASRRAHRMEDLRFDIARPDGTFEIRWWRLVNSPVLDERGAVDSIIHNANDVTEQRRAEAALRERETDLARVQRIGEVGGLDIDVAGGMNSRRSPEYLRLHGLPASAHHETHADWRRRVHPDDVEEAERQLLRALEGGASTYESEYRIVRPSDRAVRWIAARADIERDAQGQALRLIGAHIDITEQKTVQESLRRSEERLRQFGEASQDVLWIRDAEHLQWTYLTPAFETIYGLSREEALHGDNFRSWKELIVPEDRAAAIDAIERVKAGQHVSFDYRIRRPADGEIRWLRNTDFPIVNAAGDVGFIGGIGHDLTELRETEWRLQSLLEGIPQLVWRAGDSGSWTWSSPQWADYTGQTVAQSLRWGWLDVVHADDRAVAREAWERAARDGGFEVEYRIRHAQDGDARWFKTRATAVRDDAGTIVEWLGTSTDIHDLRQLQARQQVLVAELQHRTRNLMGVVRAMAETTGQASSDIADFRLRFGDRLQSLARVQGLLSRLEDTDRVAFDELIRTELAAMDGVGAHVTLEGPAGIRLRSSTVQTLAMALHELATNALKYGALRQPGGRLQVAWHMTAADRPGKPELHIRWTESGVAMPAAGARAQGSGQGRELIEKALPYQLKARTSFALTPDGVHCTIVIPVSASNRTDSP